MLIKIIRILPPVEEAADRVGAGWISRGSQPNRDEETKGQEERKRVEILNTDCVVWMTKDGEHWIAMPLNGPEVVFYIPGCDTVDEMLSLLDVWESAERD